jgi:hypothetical protein
MEEHMRSAFAQHKRMFMGSLVALAVAALIGAGAISARLAHASGTTHATTPHLIQLSTDPYTAATDANNHQTEVEPDTFAFGNTIVSAFQTGRAFGAGSTNIGWATSNDGGKTWKNGVLPGITTVAGGIYQTASDSAVAYDARHRVWLIASLGIPANGGFDVLVSRSTDGGFTWSNPITIDASGPNDSFDKDWIVCDTSLLSPFFGHCYVEFDNAPQSQTILMSTSTDGGKTWGAPKSPTNQTFAGIGGLPLVQPGGKVIVPIFGADNATGQGGIYAYTSTDGGASWTTPVLVTPANMHFQNAAYRGGQLPSAEIDGSGKVYVVWSDCLFIANCTADDIVITTSTDGTTWSPVQRIPIDSVTSGEDNFTPAIAVDRHTAGGYAHIGVAYYYFPDTTCTNTTCQLFLGFISSTNGGVSWSHPQQVAGPMQIPWLASTASGFMTGDYISASFVGNKVFPAFALATAPTGSVLHESIFSAALPVTGGTVTAAASKPVVSTSARVPFKTKHLQLSAN